MDCLFCCGSLEGRGTDDRVEWTTEQYVCKDCGLLHERTTVYQPQSRLVESDQLEIDYETMHHLGSSHKAIIDELWREQRMPAEDEAPLTTCPWCGTEYNVKETDGNQYYEQVEQSAYYQHNGVSPDTGMGGAIADRECGKFVKFVGGHFHSGDACDVPWAGTAPREVEVSWRFAVASDVYGTETYGGYDSEAEAHEGIERVKAKAREINDGVRRFYSEPYEGDDEEED